jgi:DNA-binding MurR/RpiR family transcriptional regulator
LRRPAFARLRAPGEATDAPLARIRRLASTLSAGQRKVVDLFLAQPEAAVFFTTNQVARATGVSGATVVRAARALGFGGYPEFRSAFQTSFVERMSTVARMKLTAKPRRKESEIVDELLAAELANLEAAQARLDHDTIGKAAEMIAGARRVYVIGLRMAYGLAWVLHSGLEWTLRNSRLVTLGVGDVTEQLDDAGPRDVVVGITFRHTRATVELFRACLAKGARGIALTDTATSPLAEGADVVLEAQTRLSSFMPSMTAPTVLIDVLLTLVAAKRPRKVLAALAKREADWRQQRTFL